MRKLFYQKTVDNKMVVDMSTGELKEFKQRKVLKQEDFILVFLSTLPHFFKLKGNHIKFIMALWKISSFNPEFEQEGNIIINDKDTKEKIRATGFNIADSAIDNLFYQMCKAEFIIKLCKGRYMLNPKYFFKGTLTDATKLRLELISKASNKSKSIKEFWDNQGPTQALN